MSVYKKLMQARIELQSRPIVKTGINKFAGYTYFELGDFLPTVQQIFNDLGLCGVVSFSPDVAKLTITDVEAGGQIEITSPMSEANLKGCHPIQNLGAVETYTRRYLWVTALEIVEHDAVERIAKKQTRGEKLDVPIITPTTGASDSVSDDDKLYLKEVAIEVSAMVAQGDATTARERIEIDMLDADQKTYLWTMLDSKTRSAIKAAKTVN